MNAEQMQDSERQQNQNPQDRNGAIEESGKVDRIRDILFGSQMRDYDGRFQRLDERLASEAAEAGGVATAADTEHATASGAERRVPRAGADRRPLDVGRALIRCRVGGHRPFYRATHQRIPFTALTART